MDSANDYYIPRLKVARAISIRGSNSVIHSEWVFPKWRRCRYDDSESFIGESARRCLRLGVGLRNRAAIEFLEIDTRDVGIRNDTRFLFCCGWIGVLVGGLAGTKNSGFT